MSMKMFDLIMSVSGPQWLTEVPSVYVWQTLLTSDYAKAAAISIVLLVLVALVIVPYLDLHQPGGEALMTHASSTRRRRRGRRSSPAPAARPDRPSAAPCRPHRQYALVLFFLVIVLMPLYVLIVTSFKSGSDIGVNGQWNLPDALDHRRPGPRRGTALHDSFVRTFELAIPVALISSLIGAANGFVLSRWRFPGADVVFTLILFGMFIPYQAVMIPLRRDRHHHRASPRASRRWSSCTASTASRSAR